MIPWYAVALFAAGVTCLNVSAFLTVRDLRAEHERAVNLGRAAEAISEREQAQGKVLTSLGTYLRTLPPSPPR